MSRWLELARNSEVKGDSSASTQQEPLKSPVKRQGGALFMVPNGCRVEKSEKAQGGNCQFPHGQTAFGRPKTWTGKIVSLNAWRSLSDWERHGSTGKVWNGQSQKWEPKL